ncbi:TRAP transporter large permease [Marasmitruncus massiliensis]|uniref:TRAP transporter large permease n=1 Tax=Marasmitruncus massiliensis TaxID=1944642 RepID=UPI000C7A08F5|nr:TRAP transporter large permease subunit [Marasmitruncus massiliensis]
MSSTAIVLFVIFICLLIVGVPVAVSLAFSSFVYLFCFTNITPMVVAQKFFTAADSYSLMAIPFFMIAGGLLEKGGVAKRLVDFGSSILGWLPGGLAITAFVASAFFGAISGSSAATVAAIGAIMVPIMIREGYPERFALATCASAGFLGIIIPPSIPMVIYGMAVGISVTDVFLGGIFPGIILALGMAIYSVVYGFKHKNEIVIHKFSLRKVWQSFKDAVWALLMPVIILGGIYGGIFTPTEAAAVATLYGAVVGTFVYRELDLKKIIDILRGSVKTSCVIMFIVCAATAFAYVLTRENVTTSIAKWIIGIAGNQLTFWILVTVLLLFVGTFMDTVPAVMILAPIFANVLNDYGISSVVFGVVMIINLGIGLCTPPVGLNLYVAAGLRKVGIEIVCNKHLLIYLILATAFLILLMACPNIITWLPSMAA